MSIDTTKTCPTMVSIQALSDYRFVIPVCRCGFRWTRQQIKELIDDLYDFSKDASKSTYCLQNVTVRKKANESGENIYEVIDGHQRLTAIWLLVMSYMDSKKYDDEPMPVYTLEYRGKAALTKFIASISDMVRENPSCVDIVNIDHPKDVHSPFIYDAFEYIINFYKRGANKYSSVLSAIFNDDFFSRKKQISIIWNEIVPAGVDDSEKTTYNSAAEIPALREYLFSSFCLDLSNASEIESGIRDLNIKTNTCGVPLTDFELFKADLQKKDDKSVHLDLMAEYLEGNNTAYTRAELIGTFYNEYTEFFFDLIDERKIKNSTVTSSDTQMFDTAMMNFINEVFRMNYFCAISKQGVSQKAYRDDNDIFRKMSGKEFTSFIETCGKSFNDKYWKNEQIPQKAQDEIKESIINSFRNIIRLLYFFSRYGVDFDANDVNCRYTIGEMIKKLAIDPQNSRALPFRDSLIRMALYEFVLRFYIPRTSEQKEAFSTWAGFIWETDKNADFKNFDEIVETLIGYKAIISATVDCTSEAIEKAIASSKTL